MITINIAPTADDLTINKLISLIKKHDEWKWGQYTADHVSGLEMWHANGFWFINIYTPVKTDFTFLQKLRLWNPLRRLKRAITVRKNADQLAALDALIEGHLAKGKEKAAA